MSFLGKIQGLFVRKIFPALTEAQKLMVVAIGTVRANWCYVVSKQEI